MNAAVSISYCGDHQKGWPVGSSVPGELHARMLRDSVDFIRTEIGFVQYSTICKWPIIVCATAFPGICRVPASTGEREYIWEVFRKARIVSIPENPGHQSGANWSIRFGIETASKFGCDYLIHTAEDIVSNPGAMVEMVKQMEREGSDYVGEPWGVDKSDLNAQFFGCRVSWFASYFDGAGVGDCWTEKYLAKIIREHGRKTSLIERNYRHTHDPEEHARWLREF